MGFYTPSQLVQDARRHGVEVRPVDVVHSAVESTLEDLHNTPAVRLGLHLVQSLPAASAARIVAERAVAPFDSTEALARRARLEQHEMRLLAVRNGSGDVAENRFNLMGQRVYERNFDGMVTQYRYDRAGYPAEIETAEGITRATFDPVGQLLACDYVGGAQQEFSYDRAGNLIYRKTARNFNPMAATCGRVTVAQVEELVEIGELDPESIHTPGIFVQRLVVAQPEKRIEKRTTLPG